MRSSHRPQLLDAARTHFFFLSDTARNSEHIKHDSASAQLWSVSQNFLPLSVSHVVGDGMTHL